MVDPPGRRITETSKDRVMDKTDDIHDNEDSYSYPTQTGLDSQARGGKFGSDDARVIGPYSTMIIEEEDSLQQTNSGTKDLVEGQSIAPTKAVFEHPNQVVAAYQQSSREDESGVKATESIGVPEPIFETAQAASSWHNHNHADGTSMVMSSESIVAGNYVSYIDEVQDDIYSLSPAGSPDRGIGRQVASSEEVISKDAPGEIVQSSSLVECVESLMGPGQMKPAAKRVSFVEAEDETSPPSNPCVSLTDAGATSHDLSVVSTILEKSLLSTNGNYNERINRRIEAWDADIKNSVTNLNLLHGFTRGLAFSAARKCRSLFPLRLWLINNNGATCQGEELLETADEHIQLSETMEISSIFCLLNSLSQLGEFSISSLSGELPFSLISASAISALTSPSSLLSGTKRVHGDVRDEMAQRIQESARKKQNTEIPWRKILQDTGRQIESADAQLEHHQQSVVVCIATDEFILTDEVASDLLLMQRLPVQFVIRLIGTVGRESKIAELRNQLNSLGLRSMRVLGDLPSHQLLVQRMNPWLNYGAPLHRHQEMGIQSRTISLLSQRKLNHHELREFLVVLFGRHVMLEAPDLECEWPAFLRYIEFVNESANKQWNGLTKMTEPWLNIHQLDSIYGVPESRAFVQAVDEIRAQSRYSRTQVEL